MRRVLFVDDEPKVLEGLENLLFEYTDDWQLDFVSSGEAALDRLAESPADILVTDMRMPGMDGATLLAHVKERYPTMVRIVLSGHAELEAAMRALPLAHRYLSKPCKPETLMIMLERVHALHLLVSDEELCAVVGDVDRLPARPAVYSQLCTLMSQPDYGMAEVAALVERDVGMATKVVRIANTAFFSRGQTVTHVRDAVTRLGGSFVRNLVLGFETYASLSQASVDVEALYRDSFLVGSVAKQIAPKEHADDAFLAGMTHDIGVLVQAVFCPERSLAVVDEMKAGGRSRTEAEQEILGTTHAELGAYLLGLWGMPTAVVEAVCHHHTPTRVPQLEFCSLGAVYVASTLVERALNPSSRLALDIPYLTGLGVESRLDEWQDVVALTLEANVDKVTW